MQMKEQKKLPQIFYTKEDLETPRTLETPRKDEKTLET